MKDISAVGVKDIIDSLSEGVYVCDLDRTITYWSRSAQRITGWEEADVVGRQCFDSVLCHVDKDGHQLCGEEYCPLHRAMITGTGTRAPLLVYAQSKDGERIPTLVSTAPIRNDAGRVIGGVETFRDASAVVHDLEKAKAIQTLALEHDLPADDRVSFTTHYIPHEIVGGDYFAIEKLDDDSYGLMLADVMGHGIAAALYTMHLSQLWERYHREVANPARFAARVNNELVKVLRSDQSFATAVCGILDLKNRTFRCAAAGGPPVLLTHADGSYGLLKNPGLPLGIMPDSDYEEVGETIKEGDSLLLYSDGAMEIRDAAGGMLGIDGLIAILHSLGYPRSPIRMDSLEEAMLKFSNEIRLDDDLTLMEIRIGKL